MGKVILLAEDDPTNQKLAQKTLALLGHKVNIAADGEQALSIYKKSPENISLILMDGEMPVLNGFDATKAIRQWEQQQKQSRPPIPVIAWTATYGLFDSQEKWLSSGVDGFLSKPFEIKQVRYILAQWLGDIDEHIKIKPVIGIEQTETELAVPALQQLFELEKHTPGLIKRLIVRYEQQGEQLLQQLADNCQQENAEGVRRVVHTFKSSSASFGATELAMCCKKIEQNPHLFAAVEMQLGNLNALFKRALLALRQLNL